MAEGGIDLLPRPRRDITVVLVLAVVLVGLLFTVALIPLGAMLIQGAAPPLRIVAMLAALVVALWYLLRLLRRQRDRRPALAIRPEGLTLPRHGTRDTPLRLRWSEIETFGLLAADSEFPRLHIGLTAEASAARGASVAHLDPATPHRHNRLRYWQALGGMSLPPDQIIETLLTTAARAGSSFTPTEAPLALRILEGGHTAFPRWARTA